MKFITGTKHKIKKNHHLLILILKNIKKTIPFDCNTLFILQIKKKVVCIGHLKKKKKFSCVHNYYITINFINWKLRN